MVLRRYNGTYPTTFVESGLQWDAPNAWPPHQYIALEALRALPANVSSGPRTGSGADINALSGTFVNGGNATAGEGWRDALARGLANRYFTSALCSW